MKLLLVIATVIISTAAVASDCKLVTDGDGIRVWQCAPTPTTATGGQ